MVRVQAGRLRGKLAEYYSANGADDTVIVDLPKGTYVVAFHYRPNATKPHLNSAEPIPPTVSAPAEAENGWPLSFSLGFLLGLAALTIFRATLEPQSQRRPG